MGMSASQARLLSLQARQSNLEYQGQQINQARTVLSQQATALYNSLLSMTVPTPPTTTDFQTIEYSGTIGDSEFTLGSIVPEKDDTYNVEIKYQKNGACIKGGTFQSVESYNIPEYYYVNKINNYTVPTPVTYYEDVDELQSNEVNNDNQSIMHGVNGEVSDYDGYYYYQNDNGDFIQAKDYDDAIKNAGAGQFVFIQTTVGEVKKSDPDYDWDSESTQDWTYNQSAKTYYEGGLYADQISGYTFFTTDENGYAKQITCTEVGKDANGNTVYSFGDVTEIYKETPNGDGSTQLKNSEYDPDKANQGTTVGGNITYAISQDLLSSSYQGVLEAIANSYPEYRNDNGKPDETAILRDFKMFYQQNEAGTQVPCFVKTADLQQQQMISSGTGQARVEVFSLVSNGTYTEATENSGCKLTFDSSGRIVSIGIPIVEDGKVTRYETVNLEAATVTDDDAYKDAYAEYEYETYLYDQKNKEINAKTEIIQQEDRNLELKLQRLDNERTQITTEIEAVEKVINDNIEASYKTFNG